MESSKGFRSPEARLVCLHDSRRCRLSSCQQCWFNSACEYIKANRDRQDCERRALVVVARIREALDRADVEITLNSQFEKDRAG